jgi:diguanylate cyclase (GGDEF)-like protein/PAS domain S-box-containing protein
MDDAGPSATASDAMVSDAQAMRQEIGRLERKIVRERAARKQAESLIEEKSRELWASGERYRLLAENASDVVFQLTLDNSFAWVSTSVQDVLGWEAADLLGRSAVDFVHPDDVGLVAQATENPDDGVASVDEFRFRCADGQYLWMSGRARELTGEAAAVTGRVVALRDVDELVTARLARRADRLRLKATLDSLLDPHVLLVAVRDETGRITDFIYESANDAACDYMRMSREQLEGARLLELLPGQAGSGMLAMYADAVESGRPLVLDDYAYPHEILQDERRYDIRAVRVGDALSFTWRDVTARFAEVQATAEREREYRLLAENAGDVVVRSRNGIALWISPSATEVLGWDPDALIGTDLTELIHPDERALIAGARERLGIGETSRLRYRIRTRPGPYLWVQSNTRIWVGEDGRQDGTVAALRDIDDEVIALHALRASEERYRLLADNSSDVVMHARDGLILWVSSSLTDTLGWQPDEWIGRHLDEFIHVDDMALLLETRTAIHSGATIVERFRCRGKGADYHWIEMHARPYLDEDGEPDGAAVSFRTVDAEVRTESELERRALFDDLTGLINRKGMLDRFEAILADQRRPGVFPAAIFCDIDDFKSVNDTYGHAIGDELLRCFAARVTDSVRSSDMVARVGGDEVVVILSGVHDLKEAGDVAEKIRRAVREPIPIDTGTLGATLTATASIGVTLARPGDQVDDVLARADTAMYRAKQGGRDRVLLLDS